MSEAKDDADDGWMFAIPAGLALVLLVLGVVFAALGRHEAKVTAAMHSWPSTTATVTATQLVDRRDQNDRWVQDADTTFRYVVNGRTYAFTREEYVGLRSSTHTHPFRYQVNEQVRMFYDPADPSQGSLTNDRKTPDVWLVVLGAGCAALGLPFWYLAFRMFRGRRRRAA